MGKVDPRGFDVLQAVQPNGRGRGYALGYFCGGRRFRLLAGSVVRDHVTPEFETSSGSYSNLRRRLEGCGIIAIDSDGRAFMTQDHVFSSFAGAASVVFGRQCNGSEWVPLNPVAPVVSSPRLPGILPLGNMI